MSVPASPGVAYRLLALLLYPLWLIHGLRHGRRHGAAGYLAMRALGFDDGGGADRVWVHASSVGEIRAVAPLVRALLARGECILFTAFTATGLNAIRRDFGDAVAGGVIPIDCARPCRDFFRRHRIRLGIVMETELWPELLYQARRKGLELLLINARLSRKSLGANAFVRGLLRAALGRFDRILARNARDREAFLSLGVDGARIEVVGNLKTRIDDDAGHPRALERDYLLLASSHDGEERRFLEQWPDSLRSWLLVIAPRHPDRSAALQAAIERLGRRCAVRSKGQPVTPQTEVYLADTLGELKSFCAHARIVVMGGSFDATGGHNLIEPASLGCAIVTGPSDDNIRDDIELLGPGEGVLQVDDMAACWRAIDELLQSPGRARELGRRARERVAAQPDIVEVYLARIAPSLRRGGAAEDPLAADA